MVYSSRVLIATIAIGLSVATSATMAQDSVSAAPASSTMGHMDKAMMHDKMHNKMHDKMHRMDNGSMHKMPATVTSVDAKTGKVGVEAGGMALNVHFPPKSMAALKVGDKITLHLGFSK